VSAPFSDVDGDPLTFTAEGLPEGLIIDPETGVISGTLPAGTSADGPYTVTVTATDPDGQFVSSSFVWTVENVAPEVVTPLPNVSFDDASDVSLPTANSFADPDGDALVFTAANLPEGLSIDPQTGLISGTIDGSASQDGPFDVTVTATDAQGGSTSQTFTLAVENVAPIIDVGDGLNGGSFSPGAAGVPVVELTTELGAPITFDIGSLSSDPDGDTTLNFSVDGELPPGISLDPTTGVLSGNPTVPSTDPYEFTIIVSDGEGGESAVTIALDVTEDGYIETVDPMISDHSVVDVDPYEFLEGQPIDLQRFFRERALEARDDHGRMFGDRDFLGGMVAASTPGLGDNAGYLIVEAVVYEHHTLVTLGSTLPIDDRLSVRSWDVQMADGSSMPSWMDWTGGSDFINVADPIEVETIRLRVRALLDNGRTGTMTVEIDLRKGTVTQIGDAYAQGQTLQEQLALEAEDLRAQMAESDSAQDALLKALAG